MSYKTTKLDEYSFSTRVKIFVQKRESYIPDFHKIVKENPTANYIFVISPRAVDNNCLLLLKESFLANFKESDHVRVAGELLYPDWGYKDLGFEILSKKFSRHYGDIRSVVLPDGWRYEVNKSCPSVEEFIKNSLNELRIAMNSEVRCTFKVISYS